MRAAQKLIEVDGQRTAGDIFASGREVGRRLAI
jgi:hypothetical protein